MTVLLHNAFICTGVGFIEDGAILVQGTEIAWIGPSRNLPERMAAAPRHDLGRKVVIPGLINTHAHGGLSTHRGCCDDGDLFEWAAALSPHTSHLTVEDNRRGCQLAVMDMLRNGITTACDCSRYGAGVFASVAAKLRMRSLSGVLANSPGLRRAGRPNWPLALEETKAAMAEHAGDGLSRFYLGAHSPYNCMPELLTDVKTAARRLGLPFVIHAAENRRETDIIRERHGTTPIRHLHRLGLLDDATILAHCVWLDEEEMDILRETGCGVAHNPASNAKLASGVAPIPALRRRGVPVGLGTDSTLSNNALDLFQEMKLSVLLQRAASLDGTIAGAADAFAMATAEGARVLGWADRIGTLKAGKEADLVVLDMDHPLGLTPSRVLSDLVYRTTPRDVRSVMVAGEFVIENGVFNRIDEAAIRSEIRGHYAANPSGPKDLSTQGITE